MIIGEWGLWQLNDASHPSGGDNTTYIQRMYDWMNDPYNNMAIACYFEAPADGNSSLSGIFGPTTFPKSAALYKKLFGADYTSVPDVPLNLKTTLGGNQLSLSWNSSDQTATYNVYRGTRAGGESSTPIATDLVGTSYVDTGLTNGTRYYYKVKAVNSKGLSAYSNEAGAAPSAALVNFLTDGGFETGLSGWNLLADSNGAAAFASNGSGEAHAGTWGCDNWATSPYEVTLSQEKAVPNGTHVVSAWIKSSGGQAACRMIVSRHGSAPAVVNIPAASTWSKISQTVKVTTGKLSVGFYSKATANQWINLDDVVVN